MADFLYDSFSDGNDLSDHTAETGGPWTRCANSPSGSNSIISGEFRGATFNSSFYYAAGTPATAEYDVVASLKCTTSGSDYRLGVLGRWAESSNPSGYMARYNAGLGQWQLSRFDSGTVTVISTYSQTLTSGNTYVLKLEIRDATKKLYVDGVERISSSDNTVTAKGKAGIFAMNGGGTYGLTEVTGTDAGGGGGDVTVPTQTGSLTVGTVTSSSIQITWPAGADDTAVTSYETSLDGVTWTDRGNVLTYTFTSLTASTSYTLLERAKDGAGNVSTPALSVTQSTSAGGGASFDPQINQPMQRMGTSFYGNMR